MVEPAKLTPQPHTLVPDAFILGFLKLWKAYQALGQDFQDSTIEEQLQIQKLSKENVQYLDLTNIPRPKLKPKALAKLVSLFPNITQINFAGYDGILESEHTLLPDMLDVLNNLKNLRSLEMGQSPLRAKDVTELPFFKRLVNFESTAEDEETKSNFVEKIKNLTSEKNSLSFRFDEMEVIMKKMKAEMEDKMNKMKAELLKEDRILAGTIYAFGGNPDRTPKGFLFCDGKGVSRDEYKDLFLVIGSNYGNGDGQSSFNVPDFRGCFLRATDYGRGFDPDRNGRGQVNGGNKGDQVGSYQADMFASHNHSINNNRIKEDLRFVKDIEYLSVEKGNNSIKTIKDSTCLGNSISLAWYTEGSGGSESRPKNVNVNYIIKY